MEKNKLIGVLLEDGGSNGLNHSFFASILESFRKCVAVYGYDVALMNRGKELGRDTLLNECKSRGYAAVFAEIMDFTDPQMLELIQDRLPVVTIDQKMEHATNIFSDNENGIRELVQYIIHMGHKKIAYIMGDANVVTGIRSQGFMDVCKENGIDIPPTYLRQCPFRDYKRAEFYTEELLRLPNPPTCIIYPDDYAAIGGLNVIRARGMEVPRDVSVAGYDGLGFMRILEPAITTVRQNSEEMGRVAAEAIVRLIEDPDNTPYETIMVGTVLEKGHTVADIRG